MNLLVSCNDVMHFPHAVSQFLNILLAVSALVSHTVKGADTEENLVILRDVRYTIATLCQSTVALEDFMMGNCNLWKDREGGMREKGERRE